MEIAKTESFRGAEKLLEDNKAINACNALAVQFDGEFKNNIPLLEKLGFEAEKRFDVGGNKPRLDAYSGNTWDIKIGVEREWREQMHCRSHLLFSEALFREGKIDVAVFIVPTKKIKRNGINFDRTVKEIGEYSLFNEYFQLTMPIYLIGCK